MFLFPFQKYLNTKYSKIYYLQDHSNNLGQCSFSGRILCLKRIYIKKKIIRLKMCKNEPEKDAHFCVIYPLDINFNLCGFAKPLSCHPFLLSTPSVLPSNWGLHRTWFENHWLLRILSRLASRIKRQHLKCSQHIITITVIIIIVIIFRKH